jgi:hypothetical protein
MWSGDRDSPQAAAEGYGAPAGASQETANELPSFDRSSGAVVPAALGPGDEVASASGRGTSCKGTADQPGAMSVPALELVAAVIREKVTVPKLASGSGLQTVFVHNEGASAIHSAEVRSAPLALTRVPACVCRVRSSSRRTTRSLRATTVAVMTSPGLILIPSVTRGAGTASYQAYERGEPELSQSASVPICSRACELRSYPPRPTHIAEDAAVSDGVQLAAGCVHVPVTLVKESAAADVGATAA